MGLVTYFNNFAYVIRREKKCCAVLKINELIFLKILLINEKKKRINFKSSI
jgi:hypothetical protein